MPLVAAIPAFLGTTAGAATVSAGAGLLGAAYSSSQANKAADKQIAAQQAATQQTLAAQQAQYDQTRQDQAPFRQGGYTALDQIMQDMQLGGYSPQAQQQQVGGPDVTAYMQQNPDVTQRAQQLVAEGVIGPNGQWKTAEDWVSQVQLPNAQAAGEQRSYPTIAAADPNTPAPLTAEQQLQEQNGQRDTYTRPGYINPDVSINAFQASPDYQYRLDQGNRNLNAGWAAKGALGSGAAGKAFIDYGQNTAAAEYGNWRNYVTGQTDKTNAFNTDTFQSDRAYGTGVYDANRGYNTSRADTRTNNLFNLTSIGQGATNATNQAGAQNANAASNAYQTSANNLSNIYGQRADNNASAFSGALGGIQSAFNAFRGTSGYSGLPVIPGSNTTQASAYSTAIKPTIYSGPLNTMPQVRF